MLVLAAVPDLEYHKVRRAAGARFTVARAPNWDEVLAAIRSRPVELAVVDPLLSGEARSQEIERLRVLYPPLRRRAARVGPARHPARGVRALR